MAPASGARREVPGVQAALVVGIESAGRHPRQVHRGSACTSDVSDHWEKAGHHAGLIRPPLRRIAESCRDKGH